MPSPLALARIPRFAVPAEQFRATTSDGVALVGARIGTARPAVVLCHGFGGWHGKPRYVRLAESLSRAFTVYVFDFRGHGRSAGISTFGALEIHDIQAVVDIAREEGHEHVATVGASMGGIAVIRHAALVGGVDAVLAVSTPARWDGHNSPAVRRMAWLTGTARGRRMARLAGIRLPPHWVRPEAPGEVVGKIAPVPVLIVHGRDDHFFDEEEAWRLFREARHPKHLWLASRFGHAEDGFSPAFAERVGRFLYLTWGVEWPG
jgi:alpha-beta hydrolase superfamily lysophospholipase